MKLKLIPAIVLTLTAAFTSIAFAGGSGGGSTSTPVPTTPPTIVATPPASLPISSKGTLTAYANGQVARGYINHSAPTLLQGGDSTFLYQENGDIAELLTDLSSKEAAFTVANIDDNIFTWVQVMNNQWETLYWGYREAPAQKVGAEWKLSSAPIKIMLADYIPLPFDGALSAHLVIRDDDGNVVDSRWMDVNNGKIYFQTALAGWGDEFIVTYFTPGGGIASVAYSVPNNGVAITPTSISGRTSIFIENQSSFSDAKIGEGNALTIPMTVGYNDQGTSGSPLLHLKIEYDRQVLITASAFSYDVPSRPYVKPTKYTFYQFENGRPVDTIEVTAVLGVINVDVPAGTYEVVPDFGDLFESKTLPTPPWYGGGKG